MPDEVVQKVADDAIAPADLLPACTRESTIKPPDWRYREARKYVDDELNGIAPACPSDPVVMFLIRGIRGKHSGAVSKDSCSGVQSFVQRMWPELDEAIYYGTAGSRSAIASVMEVCLIKGLTAKRAAEAGCPVPEATYMLFRDCFFDLSGIKAVHAWIQDYLFTPERHAKDMTKLRSRMLAYYGGPNTGVDAPIAGMLTTDSDALIKKLIANERHKKLFDYVIRNTDIPEDTYVTLMETALKSMSDHEFQEHMKDRDDAGSESLEELAQHIEQGVRAFSHDELKNYNEAGIDSSFAYTHIIAGKTNI